MRFATVEQSRKIDQSSQENYELPGELLMEAAGSGAAREIDQSFYPEIKSGAIAIVCGPGNNGGDGLVLARHLHSMGHRDVTVFLPMGVNKGKELFQTQLSRVQKQGLRVIDLQETPEKQDQLKSSRLVVDAIFGTGLVSDPAREASDSIRGLIDLMNSLKAPKVSLDIPSGLDADRGIVHGVCVRANMTITFGLAKPGFFVSEGPLHIGRLRVLPIGFPYEVLRGEATTHFGFTEKLARRYLPKRSASSNKSDHGHLLVIAGQKGTWGAAILSSMAAYRMGTGYVTLASFEDSSKVVAETPEVMTAEIDDEELWSNKKISAIAIGPGMGVNQRSADLIQRLKDEKRERVVLDADALTTCVQFGLFPLPASWVITPHSGELSRILKVDAKTINRDRFGFAKKASCELGCHVLLKGFRSVLAFEDRCMVIMSGNSSLAKAGTGDILTGMVGGLLAQGLPALQGTATAAYIHGRMADEWLKQGNDKRTLTASDLSQHLPQLMGRLAGKAPLGL